MGGMPLNTWPSGSISAGSVLMKCPDMWEVGMAGSGIISKRNMSAWSHYDWIAVKTAFALSQD